MPFISDRYFIVLENICFLFLIAMMILLVPQILFYFLFFIDFLKKEREVALL